MIRGLGPVGALKLIEAGCDPGSDTASTLMLAISGHVIGKVWDDVRRNYKLMGEYIGVLWI